MKQTGGSQEKVRDKVSQRKETEDNRAAKQLKNCTEAVKLDPLPGPKRHYDRIYAHHVLK